jgi:glutamate/tyrosine decarboxylase-like PLP-dependent enzyme
MRDKTLTQKYAGKLDYLSSGESTIENLLITQSALGLFSLGINIQEYGRKGYVSFAKNYQKNKKQFTEFLKQNNIAFFSGSDYTPQIYIYPEDVYELSQYLTRKGWIQSPYTAKGMPYAGIRVVIKKGQQSLINKGFVNDLKKFFGENISIPAQTSAYFLAED